MKIGIRVWKNVITVGVAAMGFLAGDEAFAKARFEAAGNMEMGYMGSSYSNKEDTKGWNHVGEWSPRLLFHDRFKIGFDVSGADVHKWESSEVEGILFDSIARNRTGLTGVIELKASAGWGVRGKYGVRYGYYLLQKGEEPEDSSFKHDELGYGFDIVKKGEMWKESMLSFWAADVDYPNYLPLAAFGRERVLDHKLRSVLWVNRFDFSGRGTAGLRLEYDLKEFEDQRIVTRTGLYSDEKREDSHAKLLVDLARFRDFQTKGTIGTHLSLHMGILRSNQNNFDVSLTRFVENYHGFFEWRVGTGVSMSRGRVSARVDFLQGVRQYSGRKAQRDDQNYKREELYLSTDTLIWDVSVRAVQGASFFVKGDHVSGKSNMDFSRDKIYRYSPSSYWAGIRLGFGSDMEE